MADQAFRARPAPRLIVWVKRTVEVTVTTGLTVPDGSDEDEVASLEDQERAGTWYSWAELDDVYEMRIQRAQRMAWYAEEEAAWLAWSRWLVAVVMEMHAEVLEERRERKRQEAEAAAWEAEMRRRLALQTKWVAEMKERAAALEGASGL